MKAYNFNNLIYTICIPNHSFYKSKNFKSIDVCIDYRYLIVMQVNVTGLMHGNEVFHPL